MTQGFCAHSWVMYGEPEFRGRKLVLPEGDVELGASGSGRSTQGIGSLRRVVRVSGLGWGRGRMLPCIPWAPGPEKGDSLRLLELESLGEIIWDMGQKGVYYELTYRFLTLGPTVFWGVLSLAWGGGWGGRSRQRPSPSSGKADWGSLSWHWREIQLEQQKQLGVGMGSCPPPGPRCLGPQSDTRYPWHLFIH